MDYLINGRIGLILDGTGRNTRRIQATKQYLQDIGYDTFAIFVDTDLESALDRNENRPRKVDPLTVKNIHSEVRRNLDTLKTIFNGRVIEIDNTSVPNLQHASKTINKFLNAPAQNSKAKHWINSQQNNRK